MNREWMRERLDAFQALCSEYESEGRRTTDYTERQRQLSDQMSAAMPTVKAILNRLDPALAELICEPAYIGGAHDSLRAAQQGLGILADFDEVAANLAADSPQMDASRLHELVWASAGPLWDTGAYRVAVSQAAVSLSAHIAKKAHSSLSDRDLVNNVFSPNEPTAVSARLHLPGDKTSRAWRSRQEGLHLIAQGVFAGIRNPAVHGVEELPEQVALEQLAVLSVVARWLDETEAVI
jgi:hypothetical protein